MLSRRTFFQLLTIATMLIVLNYSSFTERRRLEVDHSDLQALYKADGFHHISRDHELMYVHIPKTGGSTVEYSSVFEEKRELGGTVPRSHHSVRKLRQSPGIDFNTYTVATHIREPCERFISAFHYVRFDNRSVGFKAEIERFGLFNYSSVEQAVEWLDDTDQWAKLKRRIFHFRDMLNWLVLEGNNGKHIFGVDVVMCQDQWTEGVHRLFDTLGIRAIPDDLFERRLASSNTKGKCDSLPMDTQERIMDAYALDSCVFGYGKYGKGEFGIPERNSSSRCIGAQFDRQWFTKRYHYCSEKLDRDVGELKG